MTELAPPTPEERALIDQITVELSDTNGKVPDLLMLLTRAIRRGIELGQAMRLQQARASAAKPISASQRGRIRALILAGHNDKQIADAEKIDVETVRSLRRAI